MKKLNDYINQHSFKSVLVENLKPTKDIDLRIDLSDKLSEFKFEEVKNVKELHKLVDNSDKETNKGFWLFKEALYKDENGYGNINKDPWYIQYYAVKYEDNIIGLLSYSLKYDEENYTPSLHIFDIQTLSEYKKASKAYIDFCENIAKKNNKKYLTLKCYEKKLETLYKKYGFKVSDKEYNAMYKKI